MQKIIFSRLKNIQKQGIKMNMFIFGGISSGISRLIDFIITLYILVVIARVILSWINYNPHNPIVRFIYDITEPVLLRIRRFLPLFGGLDLSPVILILALYILKAIF